MDLKDRQREAMRLAARIESKAAEANSEAKSAGGKEWEANSEAKSAGGKEREPEFLFFYRCHTALLLREWATSCGERTFKKCYALNFLIKIKLSLLV